MKEKEDFDSLIKALGDKESKVVENAMWALGRIGDKRAVEPIIKVLFHGDWAIHWSAEPVLLKLGLDKNIVEYLMYLCFTYGCWGNEIKKILTFIDRNPNCKLSDINQQLIRSWTMKLKELNKLLKRMKKRSLIETKGKLKTSNEEVQLTLTQKGKEFLLNELPLVHEPIYTYSIKTSSINNIILPKHCCICLGPVKEYKRISGVCSLPIPSPLYKSRTFTINVEIPYCFNCYKKVGGLLGKYEGISIEPFAAGNIVSKIIFKFRNWQYKKMFEKLNIVSKMFEKLN